MSKETILGLENASPFSAGEIDLAATTGSLHEKLTADSESISMFVNEKRVISLSIRYLLTYKRSYSKVSSTSNNFLISCLILGTEEGRSVKTLRRNSGFSLMSFLTSSTLVT